MIKHMQIGVSPRNLKAAHEYAPENLRAAESKKMAFGPMTAADIIANALAVQFPRSKWGEQVGSRVQADAWSGMKAGIMSQLQGSGNRSQMTPEQAGQVQQLLDGVGQVIAANHGTYDNFRAAIKPLLDRARALPGLQFVPPHMFHLQAMSKDRTWTSQGLLGLEYGGTVVNAKLLDKVVTSQEVPAGE